MTRRLVFGLFILCVLIVSATTSLFAQTPEPTATTDPFATVNARATLNAQSVTPTPQSTRERIVIEPLLVDPVAGPIGTTHTVIGGGLAANAPYRLVVVFRETRETVFESSYNTDATGTLMASLISEAGDRLGIYNIDVYDQNNNLVRTGTLTISEGELAQQPQALDVTGSISAGETLNAELTIDIARHTYVYSGTAGEVLNIRLESETFDAFLALYGPDGAFLTQNDDGAGGTNAEIRGYSLPSDGEYIVVVTSRSAADSNGMMTVAGEYTLNFNVGSRVDPTTTGTITSGQLVVGELTTDVQNAQFTFSANQGDVVTIQLDADDFDPFVRLLAPDGRQAAADDDGGPGLYALIDGLTLPQTGEYTIVIDGYRGFTGDRIIQGEFRLSLEISGSTVQPQATATAPSVPTEATPGTTVITGSELSYGNSVEGRLDASTTTGSYTFSGNGGDVVTISVISNDFDALVRLLDANGLELITDDDSGAGLNPTIEGYTLPASGVYTIEVDGYRGVAGDRVLEGAYTLTLTSGTAANVQSITPPPVTTVAPTGAPQEMTPTFTPSGSTTSGAGRIGSGETIQAELGGDVQTGQYTFTASAGDTVTVTLNSDAFDPIVRILDASGNEVINDDDSGDGLNSRIEAYTLSAAGEYTIVVDGYRGIAGDLQLQGAYTLSLAIEGSSTVQPTAQPPVSGQTGTITSGETVTGELSAEQTNQSYTFTADAGAVVTISVTSADLDPLVILLDPNNQEVTRDDDSGPELNALISDFTLSASGTYTIVVDGFRGFDGSEQAVGAYTLRLSITGGDAGVQPVTPTPTPLAPPITSTAVPPATPTPTPFAPPASGGGAITYGEAREVTFDGSGTAADFTFNGTAGQVITVTVEGEADAMLALIAPDGQVVFSDDDGGAGFTPEMNEFALPQDGQYTLRIQPYAEGVTGTVRLTLTQVIAALNESAAMLYLSPKAPVKVLTFEANAGETYRLVLRELANSPGTPIVTVRQNGVVIAENALGFVTRLAFDFVAPQTGAVEITVRYEGDGASVLELSRENVR